MKDQRKKHEKKYACKGKEGCYYSRADGCSKISLREGRKAGQLSYLQSLVSALVPSVREVRVIEGRQIGRRSDKSSRYECDTIR